MLITPLSDNPFSAKTALRGFTISNLTEPELFWTVFNLIYLPTSMVSLEILISNPSRGRSFVELEKTLLGEMIQ